MTTQQKSLAAALAATLLVAGSTPGQAQRYTPIGQPCGEYYGSEYSHECVKGRFEGLTRHTCAYRVGPPCPVVPLKARR
jgi:hypothetical protein